MVDRVDWFLNGDLGFLSGVWLCVAAFIGGMALWGDWYLGMSAMVGFAILMSISEGFKRLRSRYDTYNEPPEGNDG